MTRKLTIKRLTGSDLTLFYSHHRDGRYGHQKALNLNAEIFVRRLYPSIADSLASRFPIDLDLYGPGLAGRYNIQRKIIKGETYKNWRLNGELVYDPPDDPGRFDLLQPDDFVVMEFLGDLVPNGARAVFVARAYAEDRPVHSQLGTWLGARRMAVVAPPELERLLSAANAPTEHPLNRLVALEAALEDAALGGVAGIRELARTTSGRRVSRAALRAARLNAERVGAAGEERVNRYLLGLIDNGGLAEVKWKSAENAISPIDFVIAESSGLAVHVEVKSSESAFERPIHISLGELLQAREAQRYDIYRVYDMTEKTCRLRIAQDVAGTLAPFLEWAGQAPGGSSLDSISLDPALLPFGPVLDLTEFPVDADEEDEPEPARGDFAAYQLRGDDEAAQLPLL